MPKNTSKILIPLATAAVAAAVTVGSGATWTSTQTSTATAGSGHLQVDGGAATFNLKTMKPGDTLTGAITMTNNGDVPAVLKIAETSASNGFSTPGLLTLTVTRDGDSTPLYTGTFGGWAATAAPIDSDFEPHEVVTLNFSATLSSATTEADQGKTATASYTITSVAQDGTSRSWN